MSRSWPTSGLSSVAIRRAAIRAAAAGAVLLVVGALNPGWATAQDTGTLQVIARVVGAAPAWQAVQAANHWGGTTTPISTPITGLLTFHVSTAAADSARVTRRQVVLTIDYLHN